MTWNASWLASRTGTRTGLSQRWRVVTASAAKFGLVGTLVTLFNYVLFLVLMRLNMPYLAALLTAWVPSVALGFAFNRRWTFLVEGQTSSREIAWYAAATLTQLIVALAGFIVLVDGLAILPAIAYPINLVFVSAGNFAFLRFIVFPLRRSPS